MSTGTLTNAGQQDWVAVSLAAGQAAEFTITGLSALGSVTFGTAAQLAADGLTSTATAAVTSAGTAATLALFATPAAAGTYYLDIADPDPLAAAEPFTVSVATPAVAASGSVAVGGTVGGTLSLADQQNWISVSLIANQAYEVSLSGLSDAASLMMGDAASLAAAESLPQAIVSGVTNTGSAATQALYFMPATSGTYEIALADPVPLAATESYTLSVQPVAADRAANATTTGTLTLGGSVSGTLANAGQEDWVAVPLIAGQGYAFTITGLSGGAAVTLATASALAAAQSVATAAPANVFGVAAPTELGLYAAPTASGTYYLDISDPAQARAASPEVYTVSLAAATGSVTSPSSPGTLTLGGTTTGTLENVGEVDWIAVSLTAGTAYAFTVTGLSANATVTLQEAGGAPGPVTAVNPSGTGLALAMTQSLYVMPAVTGSYLLAVSDPDAFSPTERYSVSVAATTSDLGDTAALAGTVAVGGTAAGTLSNLGQHDWFGVSLNADQGYEVTVTGLSAQAQVTIGAAVALAAGLATVTALPAGNLGAGTAATQSLYFMPATAGTYEIDISDPTPLAAAEAFSVAVQAVATDATDNVTAPLAVGVAKTGPVIVGTQAGQFDADGSPIAPFAAVVLADSNAGQTGTLVVGWDPDLGSLGNLSGGTAQATLGRWTLSGSADSLMAALRAATFTPDLFAVQTTVTLSLTYSDATGASASDSTTTLIATPPATPPAGEVTVAAAGGAVLTFVFPDAASGASAAAAVAPMNAVIVSSNGTADGESVLTTGGSFAVPSGDNLVADIAAAPVTLFGGAATGQVVIAGTGDLAFNAGTGAGSVFATGGNDLVSVYQGAGAQYVQLGNGNDTIAALAGDETVQGGSGSNEILTGAGNDVIASNGSDLIAAGAVGNATITAGANNPTVFLGPGKSVFNGGTGQATVVGTAGADTLNSQGGSTLWLGRTSDVVNSTGADTIIGGTGVATVNATGNALLFAGSGRMDFINAGGVQTILGSASGALSIQGGAGSVIALSYGDATFSGGAGAATVVGGGGALTVLGGSGAGLYVGAPGGNNSITGGAGSSIIVGGGAGDVLTAGSGKGDVIEAGAGAETIAAAASTGAEKLYGGSGPDLIATGHGSADVLLGAGATTLIAGGGTDLYAFTSGHANAVTIENFSAGQDYLSLVGFAAGAAGTALASAVTSGGNEQITLPDGTRITFQGFTGLSAGNFL